MSTRSVPGLLTGLLLLGVVSGTMAASANGNADAGKKIYLESCQNCHGPTGKGDSDMAAYLTPPAGQSHRQGDASEDRCTAAQDHPGGEARYRHDRV